MIPFLRPSEEELSHKVEVLVKTLADDVIAFVLSLNKVPVCCPPTPRVRVVSVSCPCCAERTVYVITVQPAEAGALTSPRTCCDDVTCASCDVSNFFLLYCIVILLRPHVLRFPFRFVYFIQLCVCRILPGRIWRPLSREPSRVCELWSQSDNDFKTNNACNVDATEITYSNIPGRLSRLLDKLFILFF